MVRLSVSASERVIAPAAKVAITSASPVLRKNPISKFEAGRGDNAISAFLGKDRPFALYPVLQKACQRNQH
jgi:hypothetical protein